MKDIGLKLKDKREKNGVSVEEAADDLKVRPSQIEALENGNREEFKDVAMLKYLIRDYAKYLGLDGEEMIDKFNEYLFDFTSKIPVADIEKAKNNNTSGKNVASPYTKTSNKSKNSKMVVIGIIIVILLIVIGYFILSNVKHDDFKEDNYYIIRRQ